MISIIVPIYNEEDNISHLHEKITEASKDWNCNYEIIYINDGSTDTSFEKLKELTGNVEIVNFSRNFGQTSAMQAGIDKAKGDIIIPLDADLQNDPSDIANMLSIYNQGFDIVSGWRKDRHDNIIRVIPSRIANFIIGKLTGVKLHDYGCSLKIYNAEILKKVKLYGEMHRFIPALASMYTDKITEIPVTHHPRIFGKSKYNLSRTKRVILDLFTITFLLSFKDRPMYFFGSIAFKMFFMSIVCLFLTIFLKSILFLLIAIACATLFAIYIPMGLIAEILIRIYYKDKTVYNIRQKS